MKVSGRKKIEKLQNCFELMLLSRELKAFCARRKRPPLPRIEKLEDGLDNLISKKKLRARVSNDSRQPQNNKPKAMKVTLSAGEELLGHFNGGARVPSQMNSPKSAFKNCGLPMENAFPYSYGQEFVQSPLSIKSLSLISEIQGKYKLQSAHAFGGDPKILRRIQEYYLSPSFVCLVNLMNNFERLIRGIIVDQAIGEEGGFIKVSAKDIQQQYQSAYNESLSDEVLDLVSAIDPRGIRIKRDPRKPSPEFTTVTICLDEFLNNPSTNLNTHTFKRKLLLKIKQAHDEFILDRRYEFDYEKSTNWHHGFNLEHVYLSFKERLINSIESQTENLESPNLTEGSNKSKEPGTREKQTYDKFISLREKIISDIKAKEAALSSSTFKRVADTANLDETLLCEVAEKLKIIYSSKKVANIFLVRMIEYFETKVNLKTPLDCTEVFNVLQAIAARVPEWLRFAYSGDRTILHISKDFPFNEVLNRLRR